MALIKDGSILFAAQEERFSRKKHDAGFPSKALVACFEVSGISMRDIDYVVYYDKPLLKFERLLETYMAFAPKGIKAFLKSMPIWLKEKLFLKKQIRTGLTKIGNCEEGQLPPLLFTSHHQSHAAAAFFPSPYNKAPVLCLDGVGEWATTSAWLGDERQLKPLWQIDFPHSLGLLYSAFTYYCGFRVNSGEYKLMGLAPFGEPKYENVIRENLIDIKTDGSYRLNLDYFDFPVGLNMTNSRFSELFNQGPRTPESVISQKEMDIAASIQKVTEDVISKLVHTVCEETSSQHICLAGGVALNCVANGRLLEDGVAKEIWVQPAAGDAGGALGAALSVWYEYLEKPRTHNPEDSMQGAYLGTSYSEEMIQSTLNDLNANFQIHDDNSLFEVTAQQLSQGKVVGWYQGRMEFGPRALGNRSILADPQQSDMQTKLNLKIKFRESFRPFAPIVKEDKLSDWFSTRHRNTYMTSVAKIADEQLLKCNDENLVGLDKLKIPRSTIPAVTHVNNTARYQTISPDKNPRLYSLLSQFELNSGCPVLINTSFNVRGEPIVESPYDAYRCFMHTEMDYLVLGNCVLKKSRQPEENKVSLPTAHLELD